MVKCLCSLPQMRAKLAESAFELFTRKGIKNVNLDEVAAYAGVTKGSLYWHYKSKREVVLTACAYYYRRWQQRAHAEIALDNDPLRQLERMLRFSVQSCLFDRANRVFTAEIFALKLVTGLAPEFAAIPSTTGESMTQGQRA